MNNWNLVWANRMRSNAGSSGAQRLPQQSERRPVVRALGSASPKLWVVPLLGLKLGVVVICPLPVFLLCTICCYMLKTTCSSRR